MIYPTGLVRSSVMMSQRHAMPARLVSAHEPPAEYSMWEYAPEPFLQTNNDCVACAIAGAWSTQWSQINDMPWLPEYHVRSDPSPAWLYGRYHAADRQDTGAQFGRMLEILKGGVASLEYMPYVANAWKAEPTLSAVMSANGHPGPREYYCVFAWGQAAKANIIKRELSLGRPVLVGSWTDAGWQSYKGGDLAPVEEQGGAHATFLYGYDSDVAWGLNSWGKDWGDDGSYFMPWAVLEQDVFEAWVMNTSGQVQGVTDAVGVMAATAHDQAMDRG